MNSPEQKPDTVLGARAAFAIGGAVLAGMLGVAVFATRDKANIASLEQFSQTTAVGDTAYFTIPDPLPGPAVAVVNVGGSAYRLQNGTVDTIVESRMNAVGKDAKTGVTLYQAGKAPKASAKDQGKGTPKEQGVPEAFYLKVGPGKFVRVHRG